MTTANPIMEMRRRGQIGQPADSKIEYISSVL
jgi:hypothetical protein